MPTAYWHIHILIEQESWTRPHCLRTTLVYKPQRSNAIKIIWRHFSRPPVRNKLLNNVQWFTIKTEEKKVYPVNWRSFLTPVQETTNSTCRKESENETSLKGQNVLYPSKLREVDMEATLTSFAKCHTTRKCPTS
jgi:hypothetical protein